MDKEIYEDLKELNDISSKIQKMKDEVLDLYKTSDKNKCEKLLLEMSNAEKDIEFLEKEYNNFLNSNEIY
jgi:Skp family chaperone for outer membrane proteins